MAQAIRLLSLGFASAELHLMQVVLDSAARTLERGFRLVKASEGADVAVVNWSTLNIERTQGFLVQRFPQVPLISVSETGVLGRPGLCIAEAQLLPNLAAMVYEAIDGVEPVSRARPPEYVSWFVERRHLPVEDARVAAAPTTKPANAPRFSAPPLVDAPAHEPKLLAGLRLLLVDMSSDGVDAGRQLLHGLGARVDLARDDEDAWRRIEKTRYDAILVDARLADEAGFKLCRRITHDVARKPPPVFMLADRLRPIERARGAHVGSAGFLTWPLAKEPLLHALGPLRIAATAG